MGACVKEMGTHVVQLQGTEIFQQPVSLENEFEAERSATPASTFEPRDASSKASAMPGWTSTLHNCEVKMTVVLSHSICGNLLHQQCIKTLNEPGYKIKFWNVCFRIQGLFYSLREDIIVMDY